MGLQLAWPAHCYGVQAPCMALPGSDFAAHYPPWFAVEYRVAWHLRASLSFGCLPHSLCCAEPRNMAYMTRLGLWGEGSPAFKDFSAFLEAVQVGCWEAGSAWEMGAQ